MVLLNERKNNINKAINGKKPMLHLAVNSLYPPETRSDVVSAMIDMGVDVNAVDEEGNTALASLLSTQGYIGECKKKVYCVIIVLFVLSSKSFVSKFPF